VFKSVLIRLQQSTFQCRYQDGSFRQKQDAGSKGADEGMVPEDPEREQRPPTSNQPDHKSGTDNHQVLD